MAIQTTGNLSAELKTYYDRTLLEAARPTLLYCRWGQKRPIPLREGGTINFRRFELLDEKTTALQEGVTPPSSDLSITEVEATPIQIGDWVQLSDKVSWVAMDPVLTETAQIQGVQAGESLDTLCRDVLVAGTTVRFAGTSNTARNEVAAGDNINSVELRKLRRTMRKNNAKTINGYYPIIITPDTHYDLQTIAEWQGLGENQKAELLEGGMVKRLWGFAFYESERGKVFTGEGEGGVDVHASVAIGANAYGTVDISGHSLETIHHGFGSGGSTDPLNQRQTSGWKATHVTVRLNELFLARLEHAVTG